MAISPILCICEKPECMFDKIVHCRMNIALAKLSYYTRSAVSSFVWKIRPLAQRQIQDFPERVLTPHGVCQSIIWQNFCWKLHRNERNWNENRHVSLEPLGSANDCFTNLWLYFQPFFSSAKCPVYWDSPTQKTTFNSPHQPWPVTH